MTLAGIEQFFERLFNCGWKSFLLTVLMASAIYLPFLGSRPLLGSDEPRVAAIAAEMARYGDWTEPALNGAPFLEIPPLHWWLSAASFKLFGEGTASAKLPSALAAIAAVAATFWLARAAGLSNLAAFLAGMFLATSPEFWIIGRRCIMDMTLCACVAVSFAAFLAFARAKTFESRALYILVFWAGLSGALLAKGFIGLGIPCSGVFFWMLLRDDRRLSDWIGLFGAAAFALAPLSLWLLALYLKDGLDPVMTVVWTNNIGRLTGFHKEHVEPFYYYLSKFPQHFLPWTVLLVVSTWLLLSGRLSKLKAQASYGALCALIPFLLLCGAAGKRAIYLLPLYPAAALFAAFAADWLLERLASSKWRFNYARSSLVGIFLAAALALVAADAFVHHAAITKSSYEPGFIKCQELLDSGRRMVVHSGQERIIGAAVFYLGHRFPLTSTPEEVKDILAADPKSFAVADDGAYEALGGGVRLIGKFKTGRNSYIAIFEAPSDAEPSTAPPQTGKEL